MGSRDPHLPPQGDPDPDLSVVIPIPHDHDDLHTLLPGVREVTAALGLHPEILVVVPADDSALRAVAAGHDARVLVSPSAGYGSALRTGVAASRGAFILTLDEDVTDRRELFERLWKSRTNAEVTIASRYVFGGRAEVGRTRRLLSRVLNGFFRVGLDVPIHDLSSGFRLYKRSTVESGQYVADDFDILQEIVVRAFADGWRVQEVPFRYAPRRAPRDSRRVIRVGLACLRTFGRMWRLRNSILAADYDDRAYDSRIPLQRYWQRRRFRLVTGFLAGEGPVLDVGCGSSRIIGALPNGSVAVDVLLRKLRYARRFGRPLLHASGFALPFRDGSFSCVLCSQVIEHVPKSSPILDELCRVLAPGGRLVLGTPDYDRWQWVLIEKAYARVPGGYADEHIAHYTYDELVAELGQRGLVLEDARYILRGELIMAFRRPAGGRDRHDG